MPVITRILAASFVCCSLGIAQETLNVSRDLVSLNISARNLTPDNPSLDATPLLTQAIAYAQKNNVRTLLADRGSYYFLSLATNQTHILINNGKNLTLDFQSSDLYFSQSHRGAIWCATCTNVTFQNFTVDYLKLPFTQLAVSSVDPANRTIDVIALPGYQTPDEFNKPRSPDGSDDVSVFVFRRGVPILETGRLAIQLPSTASRIHIGGVGNPWARQANLAAIKPGDVLVYQARGGPHTIRFMDSEKSTVQNVSIYSAGAMALSTPASSGMKIDRVQIIPRPGTDRLMSGNADGIHASYAGANNILSNNIVRRTGDDAFAFDAPWAATVSAPSSGVRVEVERFGASVFPEGAPVAFINPDTGEIAGTANIVSATPPSNRQTGANGESITLTLDKPVSGLKKDFGMVNTDPSRHGDGSIMQFNLIQEGVFTRGLWLSGVTGITVHDNFFQSTSKPGIFVQQYNTQANSVGPSSNITIRNNVVDAAISYGSPSIGPIVSAASIRVGTENTDAAQVASSPHSNIVVTGNRVTNSSRSAIRLDNVTGGRIVDNDIQGYGQAPEKNVYLIPPCCESRERFIADFKMAIVLTNNVGVTRSNNRIDADPPLTIVSMADDKTPKVAPGSLAVARGTALGGTTSVQITDSAGVAHTAKVVMARARRVTFQIPEGVAVGIAAVTIGKQSGGVLVDSVAPGLIAADQDGRRLAAVNSALAGDSPSDATVDLNSTKSLTLYATGIRGFRSTNEIVARMGGQFTKVRYVAPHPDLAGVDQIELEIPPSVIGTKAVPVILTVGGQTANVLHVNIK